LIIGCTQLLCNPTLLLTHPNRTPTTIKPQVIVADSFNSRVQRFNGITGAFIDKVGSAGTGDGQFGTVLAVAAAGGDTFAVADRSNRVQLFSAASSPPAFLGSFQISSGLLPSIRPLGIAVAGDGSTVYVIDQARNRAVKLRLRSPYA
jgi:DNA-binding beta-propeller fold protein YncE